MLSQTEPCGHGGVAPPQLASHTQVPETHCWPNGQSLLSWHGGGTHEPQVAPLWLQT